MVPRSRNAAAVTPIVVALFFVLLAGPSPVEATTITLFDGSLGTAPSSQGWVAGGVGATQTVGAGVVTLNTMLASALYFGYGRNDQILDSTLGVQLSFTSRLLAESHTSNDRAGFVVIMEDSAHRGVELDFWSDRIFPRNIGFTHGEELLINTGAMLQYQLLLSGSGYALTVTDGAVTSTLNGSLRDYSTDLSGVSPLAALVYPQPNILFFGDDTSSAKGTFSLSSVTLIQGPSPSPVPEPSSVFLVIAGLVALGTRRAWRPAAVVSTETAIESPTLRLLC